jgi:DHA2 family multidrug resistance protein
MIATCTGRLISVGLADLRGALHLGVDEAGLTATTERAAIILGLQVKQQALTLAISESFMLVASSVICCLVVVACMAGVTIQYRQVVAAPAKPA